MERNMGGLFREAVEVASIVGWRAGGSPRAL